jgi:hypothetical protein
MSDPTPDLPEIRLPHSFRIRPVDVRFPLPHAAPTPAEPPLGALAHFTGTWTGSGFNLIFRPQSTQTPTPLPGPANDIDDNVLELNLTTETLAFSPSLGSIPNRGRVQGDVFLNGVPYLQTISDVTGGAPVGIHFEPGIWLAVPATTNPAEQDTVVRMASVPHGTTINLQGTTSGPTPGAPAIPAVDPTPFFDNGAGTHQFRNQTAANTDTFRIPQDLAGVPITQAMLDNPNSVLTDAIAGQTIVETVTIEVASAPEQPPTPLDIPAVGGGVDNIAFLTGNPDPNAVVPTSQTVGGVTHAGVKATFWIETVEHVIPVGTLHPGGSVVHLPPFPSGHGGPAIILRPPHGFARPTITVHTTQIQYSQTVLLNFNGLSWPHISVATLTPSAPIHPPPSVWG